MLGNRHKTGLPRRIVAYYLLFCLVAIFWLGASIAVLSSAGEQSRTENACLSILGQATAAAELAYLRGGENSLQEFAQRMQSQHSLLYCAIVSKDDRFLAHSSQHFQGQQSHETIGERIQCGNIESVRFDDGNGKRLREYRAPLKIRAKEFGTLQVAVTEPSGLSAVMSIARHTPIMLLGPVVLLGLGGFVLHRMVRPMAKIESQLRQAVTLPTLSDSSLHAVTSQSVAALGWNRLINELGKPEDSGDLGERLTEAVQARREQQFGDVLDSVPEGIATTDQEGRITFANRTLNALFGADNSSGKCVGTLMSELLGTAQDANMSEDSPEQRLVDPANLQRDIVAELERTVGNSRRILRVARHPIGHGAQSPRDKHIWSIRDVTQHKLAEKMRDDFLDSVTHELRTPLSNIKAYSEALSLSDVLELEQQKDFCNTINGEVTRLARLIDDLLSISSLEVGSLTITKQRVELDRLITEVTSKVKPLMDEKELAFQTVLPEKMPQVKLDKDKIAVTLVNLLGNAAKYTPHGGSVGLKVRAKDKQLVIDVQDSGVGIAPQEAPRVFDKFFRSADARVQQETGTGLGLSLAQEVVRLHGGAVTVESELDKGSTFTITLPLE